MAHIIACLGLLFSGSVLALPFDSISPSRLQPRQSSAPAAVVIGVSSVDSDGTVDKAASNQLTCSLANGISGSANLQQIWANSGASGLLESFLVENGDIDWLQNLAKQSNDTIDCSQIDKDNLCPAPDSCEKEDDARFFFVRTAAAQCFALFEAALDQLRDNFTKTSNDIDLLISDFGTPPDNDDTANILNDISGIFGIASAATGDLEDPAITAAFGILSGIFSIAGTNVVAPDPTDVSGQLHSILNDIFTNTENDISNTLEIIFSGNANSSMTASLPGVSSGVGPNGETQNIAKFFADGTFLNPIKVPPTFLVSGLNFLIQGLVSAFLKSQNNYIFVDTDRDQGECTGISGSAFINNQCYTLEVFGRSPLAGTGETISVTTQPIDTTKTDKLTQDPYNFNLTAFYLNAADCQQAHPDFTGTVTPGDVSVAGGGFPQCFFNIPVIVAADSPCNALDQNLPGNLGFNTVTCADKPGPRPILGQPKIDVALMNGTHAPNATLISANNLQSLNQTQAGNYLVYSNSTLSG